MVPFIDRSCVGFFSEPAPQASATAGDLANQRIHRQTQAEYRKTKVGQAPTNGPQSQARLFQAMSHHSLIFSARAKKVQHDSLLVVGARILGA